MLTGALVLELTFAASLGTNVAVYVCRPDGTVPIATPSTTLRRATTVLPSRISIVPDGNRPVSVETVATATEGMNQNPRVTLRPVVVDTFRTSTVTGADSEPPTDPSPANRATTG